MGRYFKDEIFNTVFDNWRTSRTFIDLRMILDLRTFRHMHMFCLWLFKNFQKLSGSCKFVLLQILLLCIWPLTYLFLLGRDRFFTPYICFTLFFNFSYKLFKNYFSIPQSTFQFKVSVRKQAKTVFCIHAIFIISL